MNIKQAVMSLLAAGTVALTSVSPASALVPVANQQVPALTETAPIQVRDHVNRNVRYNNEIYIRNGKTYWNGYRGYREYRPGHRRHSGFWYPGAAFSLGIILAPAVRNNVYRGNTHVNWCANRYQSYRAYDNTWQPYNGPRRICVSPYY